MKNKETSLDKKELHLGEIFGEVKEALKEMPIIKQVIETNRVVKDWLNQRNDEMLGEDYSEEGSEYQN